MRVLIVDYNDKRRKQLRDLLEANFDNYNVTELETSPPEPVRDTDARKLTQVKNNDYDLIVGHIGGNPSGYECLKCYKDHNPQGKVVLYTKLSEIPIKLFDGLKRADAIFKRSDNDEILFENAVDMMDVIKKVMNEPGLTFWKNPFKQPAVAAAVIGLTTATIGLVVALIKIFYL